MQSDSFGTFFQPVTVHVAATAATGERGLSWFDWDRLGREGFLSGLSSNMFTDSLFGFY